MCLAAACLTALSIAILPPRVWGEPTKATAEKGEKLLAFTVEKVVSEMEYVFSLMEKKQPLYGSWF